MLRILAETKDKGKFIWEYKGKHANLDKAYQQLLLYRESLGNPPLLITSDLQRIIIHTNFTNSIKESYEITLESLANGDGLSLLQRVFYDAESFRPTQTQAQVTLTSAKNFIKVAEALQDWAKAEERKEDPERLAHFIIRLLFALFAEDMGLLPENVFSELVKHHVADVSSFSSALKGLFAAMKEGGMFGYHQIPHFNGGLFDDDYIPDLPGGILHFMKDACAQDWASIDPSIFGTLFERIIDEDKRAQLGAHYTSREDIMLIVEPVLMQPLREEWQGIKSRVVGAQHAAPLQRQLQEFSDKIAATRVLDPACGSGNFLYVALRQLLDLQKEVITFAGRNGLDIIPLTVSPKQLFGIELNPYAHELAQITVWIGYLQWRFENGFAEISEPILRPLKNIERKDAILAYDEEGKPIEPEWPQAEVIIGNPPFLGDRKMRRELGDEYVDDLRDFYSRKLPNSSDLVCYWFEIARNMIEQQTVRRAGLLATNSIRGGSNRQVLDNIKKTGDIFLAWSDRDWVLDGASVRVSMIGFDAGKQTKKTLDGRDINTINADLTKGGMDLTTAQILRENQNLCFQGVVKVGKFDIDATLAKDMLLETNNPNQRPNSDVVKLTVNAIDLLRRSRNIWVIDFGTDMPLEDASQYTGPIEYVRKYTKPLRDKARRKRHKEKWWLFGDARPAMRDATKELEHFIVTPKTSKHRIFAWLSHPTVVDQALHVIARSDDYFFGVLHSKLHEKWVLAKGTTLEDRPRYAPTSSTFETFPFPWAPGQEPSAKQTSEVLETSEVSEALAKENAIAEAARQLVVLRQGWLNPPEEEIGVTISSKMLKKRTLTNLYNALVYYRKSVKGKARNPRAWDAKFDYVELEIIESLDHIHTQLDHAVLDAYGWSHHLSDEQILENLLALNLERSNKPS